MELKVAWPKCGSKNITVEKDNTACPVYLEGKCFDCRWIWPVVNPKRNSSGREMLTWN